MLRYKILFCRYNLALISFIYHQYATLTKLTIIIPIILHPKYEIENESRIDEKFSSFESRGNIQIDRSKLRIGKRLEQIFNHGLICKSQISIRETSSFYRDVSRSTSDIINLGLVTGRFPFLSKRYKKTP